MQAYCVLNKDANTDFLFLLLPLDMSFRAGLHSFLTSHPMSTFLSAVFEAVLILSASISRILHAATSTGWFSVLCMDQLARI